MKLQNYFQDPSSLHIGTEPLRAYYVPCREEAEANLNSMKAITRFLKDALKKLRIPQAMIPSRFQAAGRSLDTIRISIPMSAIRFLSIRLMCRMTTRQVSM